MVLDEAKVEEEKWTGPPCSVGCVFRVGNVSFELIRNFTSGYDSTGIILSSMDFNLIRCFKKLAEKEF